MVKKHFRPGLAHYRKYLLPPVLGEAMGRAALTCRFWVMRAFGKAAGGINKKVPAAGAQVRFRVHAAAINGQHFFQDFDFKRDVVAHEYIICNTGKEIKKRSGLLTGRTAYPKI